MEHVSVVWDNAEQTAIRFDLKPECDWVEFWEAVHAAYRMMESVAWQVDLIINPEPGAMPPVRALANFKNAEENSPPNRGRLLIVGAGTYAQLLFNTFTRIYKNLSAKMAFTTSLEAARAEVAARVPRRAADPEHTTARLPGD